MELILGHLIGDYLFQSDWMAINKKKNSVEGLFACVLHCLIWTISIGYFTQSMNFYTLGWLFTSHFVLDRTNFVEWWLNFSKTMPNPAMWKLIIVDNTLHLLFVYMILQ